MSKTSKSLCNTFRKYHWQKKRQNHSGSDSAIQCSLARLQLLANETQIIIVSQFSTDKKEKESQDSKALIIEIKLCVSAATTYRRTSQ